MSDVPSPQPEHDVSPPGPERTPLAGQTGPASVEAARLPFPVVGIGASAGGLAAFEAFFAAMPAQVDPGLAIVLVQHLAPHHESLLPELVRRYTRMEVVEAEDGMLVQPDHCYTIPPNHHLSLVGGRLVLGPAGGRAPHLAIDHFFRSLATAQGELAICIVMSGTGSDGTLGLRAVKGEGGLAIVQAPDSAEHDGMPRNAINTGMADYVLAPADMPERLIAYARSVVDPGRVQRTRDTALRKLCQLLRARTGHDFSQYKETTLLRRLDRRMALRQLQDPDEYVRYARDEPAEVEALFRDLLIGVTNFFRDPEAFQVLEQQLIPQLLDGKTAHDPVRVWVCGCSTGEEAYSVAILLAEYAAEKKRPYRIQIFATDIDSHAIEHARAGVYPASIAADVSGERLARFFSHDPQRGTYRIQEHIRDLLVFSEQDVIKDPPFSRLDLVTCRNLLIYLNGEVQKKLIRLFHYALLPGGALFLGTSETVGESARLFNVVDRKWKLYTRLPAEAGGARPQLAHIVPPLFDSGHDRRSAPAVLAPDDERGTLRNVAEQALLAHYAQAAVLINSRGQILHIVGRTGKFLEPADGDAAMNILPMAREGLRRELTIALHKAVAHREVVSYPNLRVKANGDWIHANLVVRPVEVGHGTDASLAFLVVLEEVPERAGPPAGRHGPPADAAGRIAALEEELRAKDEYLQTTLEEMETANEELKSTNEEMQSVNEELQSTNEELETSKEELQSVNEELSTVNTELQDKVADLSRANNDMNNLLAGTGIGTLFVDHEMRVTRFTPATTQIIHLIPGDVGRPLEQLASKLVGYDRLVGDIRAVLDKLESREAEVQVRDGGWYLMRIRPYRTIDNLIEGAVVTLVDITERKQAEETLRRNEGRLNAFIHQAHAGVAELGLDGDYLFVNDRLCALLGYTRAELLQRRQRDITDPADAARAVAAFAALAQGGPDFHIDKHYVRKNGTRVQVHERVSAIRDGRERPASFLALTFDRADGRP